MRVVVAGAPGVPGRHIVPLLVSAGHEIVGLARSNLDTAISGDGDVPAGRVPAELAARPPMLTSWRVLT